MKSEKHAQSPSPSRTFREHFLRCTLPCIAVRSVAVLILLCVLLAALGLSASAAAPRRNTAAGSAPTAASDAPLLPASAEAGVEAAAAELLSQTQIEQTRLLILQQHYNWYMQKGKIYVMSNCSEIAYLQDFLVGGKTSEIGVRSRKIRADANSSIPASAVPFRLADLKVSDLLVVEEPMTGTHWTLILDPRDPEGVRILEFAGDRLCERVLPADTVLERGKYVLTRFADPDGQPTLVPEQEKRPPNEEAADAQIPRFRDVTDPQAPWYDAVYWAVSHKPYPITAGLSADRFGVEVTVTRAMTMVFCWAAAGRPAAQADTARFADVKKTDWFCRAVAWAIEQGITAGTDATHFSPHKTCSRSEILTFLYAAAGKPRVRIENPYSDVQNQWYRDAALWAWKEGIERGENGKFHAELPCTRASVVLYLYRALR